MSEKKKIYIGISTLCFFFLLKQLLIEVYLLHDVYVASVHY